MKVLLITQYFYPENFKSNDIAFELTKRGYDVDVLTGIPNYPAGKYYKGYGLFRKRRENIKGVRIFRSMLFPRGRGNGLRLALNYLSFVITSAPWAIFLSIKNRYDAIIVHESSPVTQGIPAIIAKKFRKTPIYFWVLDLWPESIISAGGIKNKRIISLVESITKYIYKNSDKILISSRGFAQSIIDKGNFKEKLVYFPNWGEDIFLSPPETNLKTPGIPDGFKVMFAGNIGEAQDFKSVLEAAVQLKEQVNIKWIIVGDGRKLQWVKNYVKANHLSDAVHFLGKKPLKMMPSLFREADLMLASLKDEPVFHLTVPAKLQAYMASAKPVIAMFNGEGAEIIREAKCGVVVKAGDPLALADAILKLAGTDRETLDTLGRNGLQYYLANFEKSRCIDNLCRIIGGEICEEALARDKRLEI